MTWHNLPCPATLPAVSQLCPDGWVEIYVEHFPGDSGPGGNTPQEPESTSEIGRLWGVLDSEAPEVARAYQQMLDAPDSAGEWFSKAIAATPSGGTFLVRLVRRPPVCDDCKRGHEAGGDLQVCQRNDCTGWGIMSAPIELQPFGVDGRAVYTADKHPSLIGQQPAPVPGRGDMWQQVIARWSGKIQPAIIEMFKARSEQGKAHYGGPLQAGNGRDVCGELVNETMDRIAYAEQAATERPELANIMADMQWHDIATLGGLLSVFGRIPQE